MCPGSLSLIEPQDFDRVASQQPLKYWELPWYLFEEVHPNITPPKLWAGWRVDNDDVFRVAREKMPEIIDYTGSGRPSFRLMTDGRFARRVCELCQIPEEDCELVKLVFAAKPTGTLAQDVILTCGSSTNGVVGEAGRKRMADLVAPGREPEWHLDYLLWRWQFGRRELQSLSALVHTHGPLSHSERPSQARVVYPSEGMSLSSWGSFYRVLKYAHRLHPRYLYGRVAPSTVGLCGMCSM